MVGLLCVVAIIGWMAKGMFAPAVSHDPNDKSTVEYWITHSAERQSMLQWCQQNPQQQDTGDCQLATTAQTRIDAGGAPSGSTSANGNNGTTQGTGEANDELQAQQDSNDMDPGGE